jgi:hypothetical protein
MWFRQAVVAVGTDPAAQNPDAREINETYFTRFRDHATRKILAANRFHPKII